MKYNQMGRGTHVRKWMHNFVLVIMVPIPECGYEQDTTTLQKGKISQISFKDVVQN